MRELPQRGFLRVLVFNMTLFDKLADMGHEQVVFCSDPSVGYRAVIAIHSTRLGPATGGTRFWNYATDEEALTDVLRLSQNMTYKNAVAGLDLGGGKAIIIGDNKLEDRERLFRAHGRVVETLGGRFITAEDVGTSPSDMGYVHLETSHVFGMTGQDPAPWTAEGVFEGTRAAAKYKWGSSELSGRTVALQGCGNVGGSLARLLHSAGAKLILSDVDADRVEQLAQDLDASVTPPDRIFSAEADIFAPCAMGGILNDDTIPQLNVQIIAGGANNQLLEQRHAEGIAAKGILYAPDYVTSSGGVIMGAAQMFGWTEARIREKIRGIGETLLSVFDMAKSRNTTTAQAADRLAEMRLQSPRKV
jgi:leucine dehydrogenase